MNETLEEIAKTLFKSWFTDFDPVRAKAEGKSTGLSKEISDLFPDSFVDSELGEIPKGWEVKALDEIAEFLNGLALQKYPEDQVSMFVSFVCRFCIPNSDRVEMHFPIPCFISKIYILFLRFNLTDSVFYFYISSTFVQKIN